MRSEHLKIPEATPETVTIRRSKHVLTVDLEDYFQVEAFAGVVSRQGWESFPSRVERNCDLLLDLFKEHEVRATFFVLGWVADRFPALVRRIHGLGHELACHSYWHRRVYTLTPDEFRSDTRAAREAIQQAASAKVEGYRAPTWSISKESLWALDILAEEGFSYDSSIFPIHHDLYGIPDGSPDPYLHHCSNRLTLPEFPPATARFGRWKIPAAGGGYLRLFPVRFTRGVLDQYERRGQSAVLYLHPWEVDPEQPRIKAGLRSRFRHYVNLHRTLPRLRSLLQEYSFRSFREHLSDASTKAQVANAETSTVHGSNMVGVSHA